jgi:hypothetical protein
MRYTTLYALNTVRPTCRHLYFRMSQNTPATAPFSVSMTHGPQASSPPSSSSAKPPQGQRPHEEGRRGRHSEVAHLLPFSSVGAQALERSGAEGDGRPVRGELACPRKSWALCPVRPTARAAAGVELARSTCMFSPCAAVGPASTSRTFSKHAGGRDVWRASVSRCRWSRRLRVKKLR